ncbi:MAG: DUF4112 domain-containing protein [Ilumatobacter sp.]|uniref:DUF4112 domain-containing protein n=1 Tax=Ilumatobacter sp. TaxID=1967498 RepID=UPI003C78E763
MSPDSDEASVPDAVLTPSEQGRARVEPDDQVVDGARAVPQYVKNLAWLLDDAVRIPIINKRVGVDGAIGMVPGLGDGAGFVASGVIVLSAVRQGVSKATITRMIGNVAFESFVGMIPIAGDLFDFVWKSNSRNVRLLRADLEDPERTRRSSVAVIATSLVVLVALAAITVATMLLSIWLIVRIVDAAF